MFRELEYQSRVFKVLEYHLEHLATEKENAKRIEEMQAQNPDVKIPIPDFTENAWEAMKKAGHLPPSRINIPFSPAQGWHQSRRS